MPCPSLRRWCCWRQVVGAVGLLLLLGTGELAPRNVLGFCVAASNAFGLIAGACTHSRQLIAGLGFAEMGQGAPGVMLGARWTMQPLFLKDHSRLILHTLIIMLRPPLAPQAFS